MIKIVSFNTLLGKTLKKISINDDKDQICFLTDEAEEFLMYHKKECCEKVYIDDINGDMNDLIGSPILRSSEVSSEGKTKLTDIDAILWGYDHYTWTFYNLSTIKGGVQIKWYGISNGYYSEKVDLVQTT